MSDEIAVRLAPATIQSDELEGRCVVMADILRASSTIIHALTNGATAVYPNAQIDASRELAVSLGSRVLLCGERSGQIIDGFDCGNSPLEYTNDLVSAKRLVLCTTNGTYTLKRCEKANRLFVGAFINLSAVCRQLESAASVMIACAGTNRMVTDEDVSFAGAVTESLLRTNPKMRLDDSARIALSRWKSVSNEMESGRQLWEILAESHGGKNLMRLGYADDVKFCARINACSNVPELNLQTWIIQNVCNSTINQSAMTSQNRT